MNRHPILFKTLRFGFRLSKPLLRWTKKKYDYYKQFLPDMFYHAWAVRNEDECFVEEDMKDGPLISVVVPTFNTLQPHLLEMVYSVVNQHYSNWELILVNASSDDDRKLAVRDCASIDNRIRIIEVEQNKGISGNTNAGLAQAKGEYVAFLDHDDKLHPCALHCVANAIKKHHPQLIYTDEDKISHNGGLFFDPHCKPQWSPDLLRNVNYINHLTVIQTSLVNQVGGLRPDFDGAQDYDLLLRVIDICQPSIYHVSYVLYHWRAAESSTAQNIANKSYILDAGSSALKEHLKRNHIPARAKAIDGKPGFYRVSYEPPKEFSLVIGQVEPRRQLVAAWWLERVLNKIDTKDMELVIGEWYRDYIDKLRKKPKVKWIEAGPDYWHKAAGAAKNPVIICFQEMATPQDKHALSDLAGAALHSGALAASPIIIGPDKTIIDAGYVEADFGLQDLFKNYKLPKNTYFGSTDWTRNTMGLTMGVFAVQQKTFKQLVKTMTGPKITTFDLHNIHKDLPDGIPMCLLWAHTPFAYKGVLQAYETEDIYFNSGLTQASAYINMKVSTWGKWDDRAPE